MTVEFRQVKDGNWAPPEGEKFENGDLAIWDISHYEGSTGIAYYFEGMWNYSKELRALKEYLGLVDYNDHSIETLERCLKGWDLEAFTFANWLDNRNPDRKPALVNYERMTNPPVFLGIF